MPTVPGGGVSPLPRVAVLTDFYCPQTTAFCCRAFGGRLPVPSERVVVNLECSEIGAVYADLATLADRTSSGRA